MGYIRRCRFGTKPAQVADPQLILQQSAAVAGAEQNGLLVHLHSGLPVLKNLFGKEASVVGLVAHRDQAGPVCGFALGPELLGEPLPGEIDDGIGDRQQILTNFGMRFWSPLRRMRSRYAAFSKQARLASTSSPQTLRRSPTTSPL